MLSRVQYITLAILIVLPLLIFAGVGAWALWETQRLFWLSWSIPVCWGLCGMLLRFWRKPLVLPPPELDVTHWTERDEAAARLIVQAQERVRDIPAARLTDTSFYAQSAQELAGEIARHYYPQASDPVGNLTVLEILAATQLVTEDLEAWFGQNVPGSHLVTIGQWKMLSQAPKWWQYASNAGWIASIMMNPVNLGRYFVSKLAVDPLTRNIQGGVLSAFYLLYLRQVGYYLIEMNSGRLRGGAARYRQAMRQRQPPASDMPATDAAPATTGPQHISIAVIGQVKAGKSSLVNCLLGEQQATTDVLPSTRAVQRYTLKSLGAAGVAESLVLLDTPGYGEAGASAGQFAETLQAVQASDLVLLVSDGKSSARQADAAVLQQLAVWYGEHPQFKRPPVIGVMSKIDGLSPVMEWQPPYDWERPRRPKEEHIAGAIDYLWESLGRHLETIVPVCTDLAHDRIYGVEEFLVPAMTALLSEARAVLLVKSLHHDLERGQYMKIAEQAWTAGRHLLGLWQARRPPGS